MGGKASKIIAETTLVKCNTHGDGSKFPVICATPTDEAIEGLKGGELPDSVRPHGTGTRVHRHAQWQRRQTSREGAANSFV